MSTIQIIDTSDKTYPNTGRYYIAEMRAGKHHATVMLALGGQCQYPREYVRVCVHNAANRCWQGLGRQFDTVEQATAYYKTPEIRAMIGAAVSAAQVPA